MADEQVVGAASPAPSDHKRKLDDLDPEAPEPPTADSNGNSDSAEASLNGVASEDSEAKRPRLDDEPDDLVMENGYQEQKAGEPNDEVAEQSVVENNVELDALQRVDEVPEMVSNEPAADGNHTGAAEAPSDKDPQLDNTMEESAKGDLQEPREEIQDPPADVSQQGDVSNAEQQPTSEDKLISRKMEVPSTKVGVLIGKAGDTIRTLQYNSGARIQITRDADADPYCATRPVELIGSLENINKAEKLIKDVIAEADAGGSPSLVARGFSTVQSSGNAEQIQMQVPNEKVGLIIGKGGETIKSLQTRSGARIQLIPQHLPEGDQSKERTVRLTGDKKQIEMAREMIKEAMSQPMRSSTPSSGYNQQAFRPRGPGPHWGTRGPHPAQPTGYDYQQRGPYPSHNPQYPSPTYGGNFPPQQPPPRSNFGWEQRPPPTMQGPPEQIGYDYYGVQGVHTATPSAAQLSNSTHPSHAPGPMMGRPSQTSYNYGQPQGPDYGQPTPYSQTAPPPQSYGHHGYSSETKYENQGQPYGGHGSQPSTFPHQGTTHHQGYGQEQYDKPPSYNMPQQGPYGHPYGGQPRASQPGDVLYQGGPIPSTQSYGTPAAQQQPYPYASSGGPMQQQAYPSYGSLPAANDGYNHSTSAAPGGYPQQGGGQPISGYGGQQAPGYAQVVPTTGSYGQYPSSQQGFTEQASATNNAGYGYNQGVAADPAYGAGPGLAYGAPPTGGQPASYTQPATPQPGYDQTIPQSGGYGNVPVGYGKSVSPQPGGYPQYDTSQVYGGHR